MRQDDDGGEHWLYHVLAVSRRERGEERRDGGEVDWVRRGVSEAARTLESEQEDEAVVLVVVVEAVAVGAKEEVVREEKEAEDQVVDERGRLRLLSMEKRERGWFNHSTAERKSFAVRDQANSWIEVRAK